jgi:hypothetical protein
MPFFAGIWAKVAAAGVILLAIAGFIAKIFHMGRKAERGDNAIKGLEAESERRSVDVAVATGGDTERERLRKQFSRD